MTAGSEKHDAENTQAPQTKYQTQKVNTTHTTWGDEDRRIYDEHQDEKHRTPSIHITCNIKVMRNKMTLSAGVSRNQYDRNTLGVFTLNSHYIPKHKM